MPDASTARRAAGATPLSLGAGPPVIGFDVGGTLIKAGWVDGTGAVSGVVRVPTPVLDGGAVDGLLDALDDLVTRFCESEHAAPAAIGLAVPGIVDEERGVAVLSENLGWRDVDLRRVATERLGLPVALVHDVRAGALAERRLGAAQGLGSVVTVIVGTGVSAAILVDGRDVVAGGFAGEIGHAPFGPSGVACGCGADGCLEAVASAGGMVARYAAATGERLPGADRLVARAHEGDPVAVQIWADALDALGRALAAVTAFLAPDAIVVGGGVAAAGAELVESLEQSLRRHLRYHRLPRIVRAELGADAGLVGALLAARERSGLDRLP